MVWTRERDQIAPALTREGWDGMGWDGDSIMVFVADFTATGGCERMRALILGTLS